MNAPLSRRKFLKTGGVAALGALAGPLILPGRVWGANGQTRPSSKITLGVIGVGDQGTVDLRAFLNHDDVRVVSICDINKQHIAGAREHIAKAYGNADVKVFSDFREMNADASIDAVQMTLPVHWHSLAALDAILRGKHIYHEKPMAMSFGEARLVRAAVHKKGVVFQFGTQQRSDLRFRWACELALNGRLGKVQEIQVMVSAGRACPQLTEQPVPDYLDWDRWVGPAPAATFHEDKLKREFHENISNFSLGMISCWGIHHLDIAQWGNGADQTGPASVEGTGDFPGEGSCDAVRNWKVRFEYAKAAPVTFVSNGTPGFEKGVRFIGDKCWVHADRGLIKASDETLLHDPQNKYDQMPIKLPISVEHTRNFVDAIKNQKRAICDIDPAVRADTLCQLALIAVKSGRKLRWDAKAEHIVKDDAANAMLQPRQFRGAWKLPQV